MAKYEYMTDFKPSSKVNVNNLETYLNGRGEEGWDLVQIIENGYQDGSFGVSGRDFVFKRIKVETK